MKINWTILKAIVLVICISGMFAFSNHRSAKKTITNLEVKFTEGDNVYVTSGMVNKLLIQNFPGLTNVPKENLVLSNIEKSVQANKMVKNAQVFTTVNGQLIVRITQRKPIGRVEQGSTIFYLDDEGKKMPLSPNHSARVPIISGKITGKSLEDVYVVLNHINKDDFLHKNIIGIEVLKDEKLQLKFRAVNFVVNLGKAEALDQKFKRFKAFYLKGTKDNLLNTYNLVSLEYNNQVVCTKI